MLRKTDKKRIAVSIIGLSLVMALLLLVGCGKNDPGYNSGGNNGGTGSPPANEVWLQGTAFVPGTVTVTAGTTVKWTNKDNMTHTVTSGTPGNPNGMFGSSNMGLNATFSFTFPSAGTFDYYCQPHSSTMHGVVTVQ